MRTHSLATPVTALALALAVVCGGCGDDEPSTPTGPSNPAPNPNPGGGAVAATITITGGGVSPSSVTVPVGSRVAFVNNDSTSHQMSSDPHPTHTDCPEINQANTGPGGSGQTGVFTSARTCGFHDHNQPDNPALLGTIRIQ